MDLKDNKAVDDVEEAMTFLNQQLSAVFEDEVVDGSWNWIIDSQGYADMYEWMLEAIAPCVLVTLREGRPIPHNNLPRLRLLDWKSGTGWHILPIEKIIIFLHVKSTTLSVQCHNSQVMCEHNSYYYYIIYANMPKIWKPTLTFVGCNRPVHHRTRRN